MCVRAMAEEEEEVEEEGLTEEGLAEEDFEEEVPEISLTEEGLADVSILLRPPQPSPHTHLIVLAPSLWLSRVPYFATILREPWSSPSPVPRMMHYLTLNCAPRTSTHAYFRCLHLLSAPSPLSPRVFDTIDEALQLLPVANHLVFDECVNACLDFLGSAPWSIEEEDAIRAALDALGIKPSGAVQERLDTSQDTASLEAMFLHMLHTRGLESVFSDVAQKCLQSPSASVKAISHSILLKLRAMYWNKVSKDDAMPRQWFTITKALLQFTDVYGIVYEFVNSQALSESLNSKLSANHKDTAYILTQVFEKVLEGSVPLSISQRAELVKHYGQLGQFIREPLFNEALRGLIDTLPLNHPALLHLVKSRPKMGLLPMWVDRVLHRIDGLNKHDVRVLCDQLTGCSIESMASTDIF